MKTTHRNTKGFTLVEIMIVVVIIGLLAAMAIPAFQKVRDNSVGKAMENDARQIAAAAQQYFLENGGVTTIAFSVASATGAIDGPLSNYVKTISKGTSTSTTAIVLDSTFQLSNPQYKGGTSAPLTVTFNSEGKRQ
jgi:type IV pilus assembly protein PilA